MHEAKHEQEAHGEQEAPAAELPPQLDLTLTMKLAAPAPAFTPPLLSVSPGFCQLSPSMRRHRGKEPALATIVPPRITTRRGRLRLM